MKATSGIILAVSVFVNVVHLCVLYDELPALAHSSWSHMSLAYNFYKNSSVYISDRIGDRSQIIESKGKADVLTAPSTYDTVGYGVLVGALWKVTHSCNLLDIELLQILIFSLLMLLVYEIGFMLFASRAMAFIGCMMLLAWNQLIVLNVTPARDIWGYYGGVVLLYVLLRFFFSRNYSFLKIFGGATFFAFCQFLRPNIVGQCATLSLALLAAVYFFKKEQLQQCYKVIGLVWLANILFFWVPFVGCNKTIYDRWFVGPIGHGLIASLGTVKNPWGIECSDRVIASHIQQETQNARYATPASEEAGVKLFFKLIKINPFIYLKALIVSFKDSLFNELETAFIYLYSYFKNSVFFQEKWKAMTDASWSMSIFRILDFLSARFIRFLGYCGIAYALYRRNYLAVLFLVVGIFMGMWVLLFSHFERRYVIPFAWPFALFSGYFLVACWQWLLQRYKQKTSSSKRVV